MRFSRWHIVGLVVVMIVGLGLFFFKRGLPPPSFSTEGPGQSQSGLSGPDFFADVASLPACGDQKQFFLLSPLELSDFTTITPLGLLSPTAHVLPAPHLYFNVRLTEPGNFNSLPVEVPVVAPADLTITQVKYVQAKGRPDFDDSMVSFGICREFKAYFDHLKTLAPKIKTAYDQAPTNRCDSYTYNYPQPVGTVEFTNCEKTVSVAIAKGEPMGTAGGGDGQKVFDFGAFDKRVPPKQFANPKRWLGREHFVYLTCSLDYYPDELRSTLKSRLGGFGERGEVVAQSCGEAIQDVTGTAMGTWIAPGHDNIGHESPHLALVHENIEPQYLVFSVGESNKEKGLPHGKYTFLPTQEGLVNRHFKDVKSDGTVYCYETENRYQGNERSQATILIMLPTSEKLRIEKVNSSSCGSPPWQMQNYVEFDR